MFEEINATSEFILENFTEVESNFPVTESFFPDSTSNQNRFNGSANSTKELEVNPKYLLTTNVFPETSTTPTSFTESADKTQSEMSVFSENNVTTLDIPVTEATETELLGEAVTLDVTSEVTTVISSERANSDNTQYSVTTMMTDRDISTTNTDSISTIFEPQTKATTVFFEITSKLDDSILSTDNNAEYSTISYTVTTNNPPNDTELIQDMNVTIETETSEQVNISTVSFNESYTTELPKNSEEISTLNYTSFENDTIVTTEEAYFDSNSTDIKNATDDDYLDALTVTPINLVFAEENSTFLDDSSNFTAETYEDALNGTTTDAAVGLVCREDQFLCGPLNVCINNTFLCDGIEDCPDGQDEFKCQDSCQSNFKCVNSSMCIMSEARCDGIWDCEDGTDEDDCTPAECAKHEVMCLDGSKCIKPGHICDWKYNCKDRSDEVGCVERTTCESGGKFFCNDGLCIPWSLKCDGEYDCKDGEDEGNCTCLSNEFQCNDGTCLQSSLRCDGRQDCRDADDEMGCVNVDTQNVVITFEPYHNKWAMLCGEDWTLDDGHYLCQELGFGHALKAEKVHVSFNGTWMGMRRENLTESSMWTERVSSIEICASSLAATVECQKFSCGEYPGLLHRRKREVLGSSSTQWPFIGYTSTFQSNKGCLSEILTPIWLITSAECLNSIRKEPYNGSDWYVRTNIGKNVDADSAAEKHEVLRIISHPHSSKFRSLTIRDYDVALIRLKHALVFVGDKIGAICLPEEQVPPGITCFSGVLGTQRPRALPPPELTINSLALQIIDRNLCNGIDHYNNQINQRGLCTQSSEGHTICDNDEGTPLMCLTGINKWFLAGTLTYQRFCDVYSKHPAVFSNLFSMRKFVDQVIGQKQYETPYNSSMYVIIPPTTPSPIVPEITTPLTSTTEMLETTTLETTSTTLEMTGTTIETTTSISDSTVITEKLSENLQDATTEFTEEFRSEENITAAFEITANYSTSADDVTYDTTTAVNTDILEFGVENSTTRPMFSEDEILSNNSVTDKTHDSLMMSFLNETFADSEANATEISIFENGTSLYDNDTSSVLEEITSTPNPLTTHDGLSVFTTESSNLTSVDSNEKTSPGAIITSDTDEVKTNTMTTETFTLPKEGTILTTSMVTATFNENLKIESTTSSYKEDFVNPDLKATTLEMKTEPKHREKFEFELTGEPDTDMTFALFSDIDGIKLEAEKASKNVNLSNISKEYVPRSRNLEEQPFINASDIFYEPIPTVGVPYDSNTTIFSSDGSFKEQPFINVSDIFEPIAATNISYNSDATLLPESRNHEKLHLTETTHLTESYNLTERPNTDAYDILYESVTTTEISHNSETTHLTSSSYTEENPHTSNMDIMHDSTFTTDDLLNSEITHSTTRQNLEQPNSSTSYVFYEPLSTTDIPYDSEATHLSKNESFELPHENISNTSNMPLFTTKIPSDLETTQVMTAVQDTSVNISGQDTMDVTTSSLITTSIKMDTSIKIDSKDGTTAVFDTTQDVNTTEPYSEDPTFITTEIPVVTSDITKDDETASGSNTQIFNDHLISEKLQILEEKKFTAYDTEECGMWDQDSNVTVTSEQFFMKWPALGFLQMVSHPKMCASSILSPHFVITSLSCLSFRDNQLNPDKWAYIGGLYDESSSISGTQSHLVSKIIPYPNRNPPLLFNENDLALVQVKDEIKSDRYSKNVCLPYDKPQTGQECFISGWKKSSSDDDQGREFLSIPVSIISNEECNNTANYNGMLLDSLICSMNNNESFQACQMDIGSPLFCLGENERWEIQGILNFPSPCDMTQPAVFNSVYSIQEWAIEIVRNETTYTSFSED
ncbi:uncharacterized protein LOC118193361 [Stegodyphus dumicola]|nr:uncharacterized protein LOC118193361 [Stegodyphus dumicola]